ncbi:Histone [Taenia solium]|eukprot:TsM_000423300 transcript=TsM_000423300 gene=TsM_000423300
MNLYQCYQCERVDADIVACLEIYPNRVSKKRRRKESHAIYITRCCSWCNLDMGTSSKAIRMAHYNMKSTITSRDNQISVRVLLPDEMAKHAVSEGTEAVTMYTGSM